MEGAAAGAVPDEALANRRSPKPSNPKSSAAAEYEYDDDTPLGPDHQATIPAWRPRPAQPTAAEAKFLPAAPLYAPADPAAVAATVAMSSKTRAGRAGVTVPMPPVGVAASSADFRYKIRWAKDAAGRRKLISAAINALDKQLGPNMVKVRSLHHIRNHPTYACHTPQGMTAGQHCPIKSAGHPASAGVLIHAAGKPA